MLGSFKLNFILLYIICGFAVAYFGVYIMKRHYLGRIWGAIIISVIGSFLGALLSSVFLNSSMSIFNITSALIMGTLSLYVFGKASKYHHD
ncbi:MULTISPECIES: hypothetical protein [unclassified Oceanispirochaeta]|uniref:hypothetical protein n=1 Tax=unclassified Oceanispirochaeta TaxID=2635722 RepID=UPI000E08F1FF|nr:MULTISPECIES: hypothetical protein [unclassified Oceanispirochaeta]MBF9016084.1 hypothetical protein [Oceanispirochaeta sp. M2]NPD72547.1 hypothetical protein [Oceanispirochaeta sp. M1]RDG32004.1 hypothetical protein DV872_10580 [Oceanispirochaeta sp. M1]